MKLSDLPKLKRITCPNTVAKPNSALTFFSPNIIYAMKWDIENAMPELADEEKEIHNL